MENLTWEDLPIKGKVLDSIDVVDSAEEGHRIVFKTTDGLSYLMFHRQDCCEDVRIEDIVGNLDDLIGCPLLVAQSVSSSEIPQKNPEWPQDSHTWTFYKFATQKGYVDIRWYGTSNGYYSESVDFEENKS